MPKACLSLWPTEGCEWSTWDIWRSADLVERIICLSLAVMLGYTFFVLTRFLLHHHRCHYELCNLIPDFGTDDLRNGKQLISELSHGIAVLKGISTAAPFLGLAGTSYGILCALWFPYSGSPDRYFRLLFTRFAFAMTTTLAGIVVALTATVCYYLLRKRIESLSSTRLLSHNSARSTVPSFRFAHSLPLKQRFAGLPPFALLATPALASVIALFTHFILIAFPSA